MPGPVAFATWGALLAAACASAAANLRLTEKDDGRSFTVRRGEVVEVALAANPTTGYSWRLVASGEPALRAEGEPAFAQSGDLHGSGGVETRRFKAVGRGSATLRLEYRRPWEKDVAAAKTFAVHIAVGP